MKQVYSFSCLALQNQNYFLNKSEFWTLLLVSKCEQYKENGK